MIERYRAHCAKLCQVVLVWIVVSVPRNNIVWAVVLLILEHFTHESIHYRPLLALLCIIGCNRGAKVPLIRAPIGADWSQIRYHKVALVELGHPAARFYTFNIERELAASWHD